MNFNFDRNKSLTKMFNTPTRASESPDVPNPARVAPTGNTGRGQQVAQHYWPVPRALELADSNSSRVTHTLSGSSDLQCDANVCSQNVFVMDSTYSFLYDDRVSNSHEYERSRELTHTMSNSRRCLEAKLGSQYLRCIKCTPRKNSVFTEKNTHETQVNYKNNVDDKTTKTESILNNTYNSLVATKRERAEKMTYCRAVLSSKWEYQKKVAEKNYRLQLIVKKLVEARQREKQKDAWEHFINVLKNKHGIYDNDSILMPNRINKDEYVQPEVTEDFRRKILATRSTNVCRNLLKDIYGPHSSSTVDNINNFASRHEFGNTTLSIPSYSPALFENEPFCYPTSSQYLRMRYKDSESQSPCFKSGCAPHSYYRKNRIIVDRDFVYGQGFNSYRRKKRKHMSNRRTSFTQTEDYWSDDNEGDKFKEMTHDGKNVQEEEAQTNNYKNKNTVTSSELSESKKYDASFRAKNESDSGQNERKKTITNKNNKDGRFSTEVPLNVIDSKSLQRRSIEKKYDVLEGNNNDDIKDRLKRVSQVLDSNEKTLSRVSSNINSLQDNEREGKRSNSSQILKSHRTSRTRKGSYINNVENNGKKKNNNISSREITSHKISQSRKSSNRNSKKESRMKEKGNIKNVENNNVRKEKRNCSLQVPDNHRISQIRKGPNRNSEVESGMKEKGSRNSVENSGKEEKINISLQVLDRHRISQTKKGPNNNSEEESEIQEKRSDSQIHTKQENNVRENFMKESTEITELTDNINSNTTLNHDSLVVNTDTIPELTDNINFNTTLNHDSLVLNTDTKPEFYENLEYDASIIASNETTVSDRDSGRDELKRTRTNKHNNDVGVSTEVPSNISDSTSVQSKTIKENNHGVEENNIKDRLKKVSQALESHKKDLTRVNSNINMCVCVQDNRTQGKISDSSQILDSHRISQSRKSPIRNSKEETSMKEKGNYSQIDTKQEEDLREKFQNVLTDISEMKDKINSKTTLNRDSLVIIHNKLDVVIKTINSLITEIKHKLPDSDDGAASKYKKTKSSSNRNSVANTGTTSVEYATKNFGVNYVTHTNGTSVGSCCSLLDTLIVSKCTDRFKCTSATCRKKIGEDDEMNNDVPHDYPLSCKKKRNADTDSKTDNTHDQFACTMTLDQQANTLFLGTIPNKLSSTDTGVTKIIKILIEELIKSNQAKKDIENILKGETYRSCGVKITFDVPTKETSTEVTASLPKTKLSEEMTCTTVEEIRAPIDDDKRNGSRMATAVNTDPLSLQALLMVSGQTVRNLMSFMRFDFPLSLFNIQTLRLRMPLEWTRVGVPSLTCNLSGTTITGPKQLNEQIRRHNIGHIRNCCVGCCLVDLQEHASSGFTCQYCGQIYSRAYCCELHQQSCAKRLGRRHDVTESLSLLS